jgi:hypothetical protein
MFEPVAVIVSLVSLGVSWRAYLLSKRGYETQAEAHRLQRVDIEAKQEPRIQVSNETFLSSWQTQNVSARCQPEEIELHYSSLVTNKGETVAAFDTVIVEVGPVGSPLAEPTHTLGFQVSGPMYLAAGESITLRSTIDAQAMALTRLFFQHPEGVLVFRLVFKFRGYAGQPRMRRTEIDRMNHQGGIVTKGNYNAAAGIPRTYLLVEGVAGA